MTELAQRWNVWFDRAVPGMTAEQYEAGLKNLGGFSTVEEFWAWLLALPPLGSLANKSSFHIMKDGHRPVWEDENNAEGGVWTIRVSKSESERTFEELMMAVIGEQFDGVLPKAGDRIIGVTASVRSGDDVFRLWHSDCSIVPNNIPTRLRALIPQDIIFRASFYKPHRDHRAIIAAAAAAAAAPGNGSTWVATGSNARVPTLNPSGSMGSLTSQSSVSSQESGISGGWGSDLPGMGPGLLASRPRGTSAHSNTSRRSNSSGGHRGGRRRSGSRGRRSMPNMYNGGGGGRKAPVSSSQLRARTT